ncbi:MULTISPECIES: F0F1 ATP synthase subunit delta [Clostridia]|uniref:F0F1 ATP synthase subunit delta n=1 Tax=Clostridia TaxID=186801 RepID=UPI000EA4072C|nr:MULTISPECIES: F0F1 ATP synthase subunit delta [Clostridia]NBJ68753.1 F0F1 ATP synthase subunit delta [Roseburia sp. 1XD42-34]RKI80136.1 F0F1 ATP synthase subunit delta [Clostridium sp. 1xD42-85]
MSHETVAKRYADALFQLGQENGTLDVLAQEMKVVKKVFQDNKNLYTFLVHPRVSNAKKQQFLQDVFQQAQKEVMNTLQLLAQRHRIELLPAIVDHFIQLVNDAKGIAAATVYSVRALSEEECRQLELSFAKRFAKRAIELNNVVDPSLIGGMKIRVGNTIYDGSVSGMLKRIERNIVSANK